jgi:septum site-determining protein MinC
MSKIAIISQPDQGVLIDVGGCGSIQEAVSHLSNTLQVSNQFWKGVDVALNLGTLELTPPQVAQILAIAKGVGAAPQHVFSENEPTRASLRSLQVRIGRGKPMKLPEIKIDALTQHELVEEEEESGYVQVASGKKKEAVTVYETDNTVEFASTLTHESIPAEATVAESAGATTGDASANARSRGKVKVIRQSLDQTEDGANSDFNADADSDGQSNESDGDQGEKHISAPSEGSEEINSDLAEIDDRQQPPKPVVPPVPAVLYLRQHLRSGQTVSHKGHLVIIGDVNPGAEVMAEGDVTVWGALRGIAHAGIGGNTDAEIRALKLQPIQIRIANAIARSPDKPRYKFSRFANSGPETARIIDGKIKIAKSSVD